MSKYHSKGVMLAALLAAAGATDAARAAGPEAAPDELRAGFADPPQAARPRVWWHWMAGEITEDGIRKDLEWMSRAGLGGVQAFQIGLGAPRVVPHGLPWMSPEWQQAFRSAVTTADRLGLEFGIAGSPGWSESGGPWVAPQDAMKKLVWSETVVQGGRRFAGRLVQPPSVTGPYQAIAAGPNLADLMSGAGTAKPPPVYYGDTAVIAYPAPEDTVSTPARARTADGAELDPKLLVDAAAPGVEVSRGAANAPGAIILGYGAPLTIRSATVFFHGVTVPFSGATLAPVLEAEDAAGGWRKVADVPLSAVPTTVSFAPVTAQRFRLVLAPPPASGANALGIGLPGVALPNFSGSPPKTARIALLQLSSEPRVNRAEAKAGFAIVGDYYALDQQVGPDVSGVAPASVIDLTDRMRPDGSLDWTPPPGRWRVLRLGYSLVGTNNHPAPREATGLEVDEYDGAAVRRYSETYLGMYAAAVGPGLMGARGLHTQVNDSTEIDPANWTPALLAQFQRLRGYDPRPWLPTLTGAIVASRLQSDAFLYDFRRTLADLVASEHYGTIAKVVHEHGMVAYAESLEGSRPVLGDDLAMRSHADVPMGALWVYNPSGAPNPGYLADMRGAASVAHVYGRKFAAAESMTSAFAPWAFAPADLKRYIDLEFASGINLPVIHSSVHQPLDDKAPGLSLSGAGQYFNRHETWAEMARPWVDYIASSAYLLQQGRNVADVAYFYGEEGPVGALYKSAPPADAPARYAYDYVNADIVLGELSVEGRELRTPGGARYRALYLGGTSRRMSLPVLRRLAELAEAGATIVGPAPETSPGLRDDPAEFASLVHRLWSGGAVTQVGRGQVIAGRDVEEALRTRGLGPDFSYSGAAPDSQILFVHRKLADGDLYFVNNRRARAERVELQFRVSGKIPEIWRADSGATTPTSYRQEHDATFVPLELGPEDAVFVVFRTPAKATSSSVAQTSWTKVGEVSGGWRLAFQPGRGAPAAARLEKLDSLTARPDPGIRYFSGTVTYRSTFVLPRGAKVGAPLMLDLGKVGDIAEVSVNGHAVGYAWKAPYRVDVTRAVKRGRNTLEVKVADLWVNRLIGDAQPGAKKITYTSMQAYLPTAPLRPSGLIGPVTLVAPGKAGVKP